LTSAARGSNLISYIADGRRAGSRQLAAAALWGTGFRPRRRLLDCGVGSTFGVCCLLFMPAPVCQLRTTSSSTASRRPVQSRRLISLTRVSVSVCKSDHSYTFQPAPARPHSARFTARSLNTAGTPTTPLYALNMMLRLTRQFTH
jgi:hypothetical protein